MGIKINRSSSFHQSFGCQILINDLATDSPGNSKIGEFGGDQKSYLQKQGLVIIRLSNRMIIGYLDIMIIIIIIIIIVRSKYHDPNWSRYCVAPPWLSHQFLGPPSNSAKAQTTLGRWGTRNAKHLHSDGKSPCLLGKLPISMAMASIAMLVITRGELLITLKLKTEGEDCLLV